MNGVDVGDIRHSREFASGISETFYETLKEELNKQANEILLGTGRPSPISLMSDKYSPNRRTLDIVGANLYLNGRIQSVYLEGSVVKDHTAEGISNQYFAAAENNFKSRENGGSNWKDRYL